MCDDRKVATGQHWLVLKKWALWTDTVMFIPSIMYSKIEDLWSRKHKNIYPLIVSNRSNTKFVGYLTLPN